MLLNSRIQIFKNYRNVYVKSSAKREYRDKNVFLKGDRALSKLINYQNAKRHEARSPNISEREASRFFH